MTRVQIGTDGDVRCLYTEEIDLQALGTLDVTRASQIEFDAKTQQWQVQLPDSAQVLFKHRLRETCLEWEKQNILNIISSRKPQAEGCHNKDKTEKT